MRRTLLLGWLVVTALGAGRLSAGTPDWVWLFNGKDLTGWQVIGSGGRWTVQDGAIVGESRDEKCEQYGYLVTERRFRDFVLHVRFRCISGNSGIQFRSRIQPDGQITGYQADPYPGHPGVTGALHEQGGRLQLRRGRLAAEKALVKDGWNDYEIAAIGNHIIFWLNGEKVMDYRDRHAKPGAGVIGFEVHKGLFTKVLWKDIRILELPRPVEFEPLFNRLDLAGWKPIGDADWSVVDRAIRGVTRGGGFGWLVSDRQYADFVLRLRFRWLAGNSGVQFRSRVVGTMVHGYQADIDPDRPRWTGMLYDEGFRGKLVEADPQIDRIFKRDGWNDYEISAIGNHIMLFINGVKAVDFRDPLLDPKLPPAKRDPHHQRGIIALQVHSGPKVHLEWKDLRILDLSGLNADDNRQSRSHAGRAGMAGQTNTQQSTVARGRGPGTPR